MSKDVTYAIVDKKWNKEFDEVFKIIFFDLTKTKNFFQAKEDNGDLKFVESDWLELCHKRKKLVPFNVFEILKE